MKNKRTKIIATLGPSSHKKETIRQMIQEGMNVARLNFSHGTAEDHREVIQTLRELARETDEPVGILADLQGPKLRIGNIKDEPVHYEEGDEFILTTEDVEGTRERIHINFEEFPQDVNPGEQVLLDDGKIVTEVVETDKEKEVKVKVLHRGELVSKKGVNLPNTQLSLPCLTEKDREDLELALECDVDWIGLSFVRSGRDIIELKHIIRDRKKDAHVIAKIEKPEALDDIDEILKEADGLMVARGDLGVEIPMQNVPLIQKMLIQKSLGAAKPVIVATQMMESMIENISPSRAEVNDVANAVLDGTDAVMLSAETSVGKYPIRVIEAMRKIAMEVEAYDRIYYHETPPEYKEDRFISDSICYNAARLAKRVDAAAIVTMTHSGYTAFKISSQRPKADVYVFTGNERIMAMLNLLWGVRSFFYDKFVSTDHTIDDIKYILRKKGKVEEDDLVINIASMPIAEKGKSNMLKLSYVG